jgi:ATP-dependent Lon protease
VQTVVIPADNKTNVEEDLTPEQLQNVEVKYVSTIDEVLDVALPTSKAEEKQDAEKREEVLSGAGVPAN